MALLGKSNQNSVLDNDAMLYKVQQEKSEKQKWSELNFKQRINYFIDYYLLKSIICIILIFICGSIIWNFLKPPKDRKLFLAIVHNTMIPEEKEYLEQLLSDLFITDSKQQEIRVDDSFPIGYESDAKLSAFMNAQEIDLIITNEKHFQTLAKNDCLVDLEDFMPSFINNHKDLIYRTEGYTNIEETIIDEYLVSATVSSKKAYGLNVTNCPLIQKSWYQEEDAILGIVQNCKQPENAILTVEKLFLE